MLTLLLLAGLTIVAVSLQKTFAHVPVKELKRRAAKGDEVAKVLYRAVAYGLSLQILLWLIVGLSAAGFLVVLARLVPSWLAFCGALALLWVAFAWLPKSRVTASGQWLAKTLTPPIDWLLIRVHPALSRLSTFFRSAGRVTVHTGLYEKEDLFELLNKQNGQLDNRITADELALARHALQFEEKNSSRYYDA